MDLSFVILTWNSKRFISPCIESIIQNTSRLGIEFEIFVVDNGSIDGTVEIIADLSRLYPKIIQPIFLSSNQGTTRSRNMAIRKAGGDKIVILDSDVRLLEGVVVGLMEAIGSYSGVGLVAPRLIYPDGRYQKSVDVFPTVIHKIKRFFGLRKMERGEQQKYLPKRPVEVDYAISAFWMIRREALEKVGLLDEKIFYAPEDVDYCLRMWKSGFKILYDPRWTVIHDAQEISRGFRLNRATVSHVLGLIYLFKKHRYCLLPPQH